MTALPLHNISNNPFSFSVRCQCLACGVSRNSARALVLHRKCRLSCLTALDGRSMDFGSYATNSISLLLLRCKGSFSDEAMDGIVCIWDRSDACTSEGAETSVVASANVPADDCTITGLCAKLHCEWCCRRAIRFFSRYSTYSSDDPRKRSRRESILEVRFANRLVVKKLQEERRGFRTR